MKLILTTLLSLLVLTSKTVAQGSIIFANVTMDLAVEKRIMDFNTSEYLTSQYVAQLFSGPEGASESALCPVDTPVAFLEGAGHSGLFFGSALVIPGVLAGSVGTFQVRVWPSEYPNWDSGYQAALVNPNARIGRSQPFTMRTGSADEPTELAIAMPMFGVGVIPEPSMASLLGVAAIAFYITARRRVETPHPRAVARDHRLR